MVSTPAQGLRCHRLSVSRPCQAVKICTDDELAQIWIGADRSGANHGAEAAFQKGCAKAGGPQEIWLPWLGFNGHPDTGLYPRPEHLVKAAQVHPLW